MQQRRGNVTVIVLIVLAGIALAVANVAVLTTTLPWVSAGAEIRPFADLYRQNPSGVLYFIVAPVILALLLALVVGRIGTTPAATPVKEPPVPNATASSAPAFRLLGVLQQEGRLIDFLAEDIDAYGDAQVGAAVRAIHANCRKALNERVELQRIFAADDGSQVVVEKGFDPAAVRLTGNVAGEPPFRGTLQHGGWRATKITLPESPGGIDPTILAPAEVEIV